MMDLYPPPIAPRAMPERTVFFVSDGTGITAETFGNSILAQFPAKPRHVRRPFIDTWTRRWQVRARDQRDRRARGQAAHRLHHAGQRRGARDPHRPDCKGLVLDMFRTFVEPLEAEFGVKSNHRVGRFSDASEEPGVQRPHRGHQLQLAHDDGQSARNLAAPT
jgi:[pyruvate, water dikinase]-phosphate phosphotransferase / [pyruvate, water dikinase] kinase